MKNNIPHQLKKTSGAKALPGRILIWIMASFLLLSCEEEETPDIVQARIPVLTATPSALTLSQRDVNRNAVTFSWTTGTNHGTAAAIDYILQLDKGADDFKAPVSIPLGRVVYAHSYNMGELNALLINTLNIAPGTSHQIKARIKSVPADSSVGPDYSNIVPLTVTPYKPVTPTLYLIGDASPNGWNADEATAMEVSPDDPTTFTYQGQLIPGSFKFITTLGQFLPSYNKGEDATRLVYRSEERQPDEQFLVTQPGDYLVTVNLVDLTISIAQLEGPPYSQLWIIGGAVPKGWSLDEADEMKQSQTDPFVFTYNEMLKAGELKIATAKDFAAPFYRPTIPDAPITSTAVQLSAGDPDNKWIIPEDGAYRISLNLREETISIVPFEPYAQLWIVGDATPAGWNIDAPTAMTADPADPFIFTYTGPLAAGEFKIPTSTGDWGTDYFMPVANHQDITLTEAMFVPGGNPDYKWKITEAGNYTITLHQLYPTVFIQKN